jgi:hypothetical protein
MSCTTTEKNTHIMFQRENMLVFPFIMAQCSQTTIFNKFDVKIQLTLISSVACIWIIVFRVMPFHSTR